MFDLLLGILASFVGGEIFVRGILGISNWLRVPKAVTAATFAAFATSSPEISVAVVAALNGTPEVALGDALGSNIVNVALILGIVLCIGPLPFAWKSVRRDFVMALVIPLLILVILLNNQFSRWEAILCLVIFAGWLLVVFREAIAYRKYAEATVSTRQGLIAMCFGVIGLVILAFAGKWIVSGAVAIGTMLGLDLFLTGAVFVAFGTSAPELATALIAKWRGHDEVGIGTILGSNIFNCLFIVGLSAVIRPFSEPLSHVFSSIIFGMVAVLALFPFGQSQLTRRRGYVLLLIYALSIVVAWWHNPGVHK